MRMLGLVSARELEIVTEIYGLFHLPVGSQVDPLPKLDVLSTTDLVEELLRQCGIRTDGMDSLLVHTSCRADERPRKPVRPIGRTQCHT